MIWALSSTGLLNTFEVLQEAEGESVLSRLHIKHRAKHGAQSYEPQMIILAEELDAWSTEPLRHPYFIIINMF